MVHWVCECRHRESSRAPLCAGRYLDRGQRRELLIVSGAQDEQESDSYSEGSGSRGGSHCCDGLHCGVQENVSAQCLCGVCSNGRYKDVKW